MVVPAYNEEQNIRETIMSLRTIEPELKQADFALLVYVVDDGSTDNTKLVAREAGADKIVVHKTNLGLGAAVRSGLLAARREQPDVVVKFDADMQHDHDDIIPLVTPILNDEADVVYGNRFERITYRMPLMRKLGNIVFTKLMSILTKWPLKDSQPGIFAINHDYLAVFNIPGDYNYTQQILLDAYHQGMRFAHVPVVFRKRVTGTSFVSLKYPLKVLQQLLLVVITVKPLKVFFPVGLSCIVLVGSVFSAEFALWLLGRSTKPVLHANFVLGFLFFGLQTFFFGLLAELVIRMNNKR